MPVSDNYRRQAALLVRTIPLLAEEACFALKGGTAINLFLRDLPRLSVDLDLTYLPVAGRAHSLAGINAAMLRLRDRIQAAIPGARVSSVQLRGENAIYRHFVEQGGVRIKIEVTPVLRGCVYEPETRTVSPRVEEQFGFAETTLVSFADLYGGKLVAALDRQHPRDLFDVGGLLAHEGITAAVRGAFLVYILSHDRPMAEVLAPARLNLEQEFQRGFVGMTDQPVTLAELDRTREAFIAELVGRMPEKHRRFLVSFERGEPDWGLLDVPHAEQLPAVQWRLQNLAKLAKPARAQLVEKLRRALDLG